MRKLLAGLAPGASLSKIGLLLAASLGPPLGLHHDVQPGSSVTQPSPEALLLESERMGENFFADDRSFQLFRLAEVASELGSESSRKLVGKWSDDLFRSAQERPRNWDRGAFEKNAAVLLASVDPDQAFRLLKKVDPPDLSSHPAPPEDLRAFGARTVFPDYWKQHGVKALAPIREAALSLGSTGEYPYPAMAAVLGALGTTRREKEFAEDIFDDALHSYQEPNVIQSSDRDFAEFLELRWPSLDRSSRLAALRIAVGRLTTPRQTDPQITFASRVTTGKGAASFDSEQMLLLYQFMTKIRQVDPDWAAKLESQYPAMGQPGDDTAKPEQTTQVTVENPGSHASADAVNSIVATQLQSGTLRQLRAVAGRDLDLAMRLLAQLTVPEYRADGMASIAVQLSVRDFKGGHSMLETAMQTASGIPTDLRARARACLSVAQAAAALKEQALFHTAIDTGFLAAQEAVQQDIDTRPGTPYYLARGMDELSNLMDLDMRTDPDDAVARTNRMQDGELKAFLLIDCAEGMTHAGAQPGPQEKPEAQVAAVRSSPTP